MGFFNRSREAQKQAQKQDAGKDEAPKPSISSEQSMKDPEKNQAKSYFPPVRSRNLDPDARPSKFSERLSIATATSSELGHSYRPRPEQPRQQGQGRSATRNAGTRSEAVQSRATADEQNAPPPPQGIPTRTASAKTHPSKTVPKRSATFNEKSNGAGGPRPGLQRRKTTAQTRYMEMLLDLDKIPRLHNILAAFSTWVLLAGYLVFPATFNSLRQNQKLDQQLDSGLEAQILKQVKNAPLLYVAAIACGIGVGGCLWIWLQHRKNYIWVINRIFLPVFMNSLAGLISTLVNVYSAQQGQYSITAKVTVTVTGACTAVAAGLFLLYNNLALEKVKKKHRFETEVYQREVERWGDIAEPAPADQTEAKSAGFLTRWMSKVKKPGVDPESVV